MIHFASSAGAFLGPSVMTASLLLDACPLCSPHPDWYLEISVDSSPLRPHGNNGALSSWWCSSSCSGLPQWPPPLQRTSSSQRWCHCHGRSQQPCPRSVLGGRRPWTRSGRSKVGCGFWRGGPCGPAWRGPSLPWGPWIYWWLLQGRTGLYMGYRIKETEREREREIQHYLGILLIYSFSHLSIV